MMSLYRTPDPFKNRATFWVSVMLAGFWSRSSKVREAHERKARLVGIDAQTVSDTRHSAQSLTGIGTWQEDLPFFMQSGFGRKE